jgi:hypothetical protein
MSASVSAPTSTNTLTVSTCLIVAAQYTGSVPLLCGFTSVTQPRQRTHALRLPPLCRHVDGPPYPNSSCVSTSTPPATRLLICATLPSADAFISSLNTPVEMERTRIHARPSTKHSPPVRRPELACLAPTSGGTVYTGVPSGVYELGSMITSPGCSFPNAFSASATAPLSSTGGCGVRTPTRCYGACLVNPA